MPKIKVNELCGGSFKKPKIAKESPFLLEDGYPRTDFFKTKKDLKADKAKDGTGLWLVGSMFFPSSYEKNVGKGKPVYCNTKFGVKEWRPVLSRRFDNFLESQGPGCTDLGIPLKMEHEGKVYIYCMDGMQGDSITVIPKKDYKLKEALRALEDYHLEDQSDDYDEEW